MFIKGFPQSSAQPAVLTAPYHHPSADKESWQRLNLWLSSTFLLSVKEGQIDLDSCLIIASGSLGMSRYSILAEGIDEPGLAEQSQWIDERKPGRGLRMLSQAKGKRHLETLILLGAYYAFQPGSYPRYKDSVEYFLTGAIHESRELKEDRLGRQALCLLGKIYIQANESKGDSLFSELIRQCRASADKETEARAIAYRGIFRQVSATALQSKLSDFQKAAELYHVLNDTEGEINVLTDVGYVLTLVGQLQQGYEAFLKALRLVEGINYPYAHYNTDAITMVTAFQGKFGEPLKYALQTIKVAETRRDSLGWGYFYARLGMMYSSEGREKESHAIYKKAIERFAVDHNPGGYLLLHDIIGYMEKEGRRSEVLDFALGIVKKLGTPVSFTEQFFYHQAFANCYIIIGELALAEMHISQMDAMETKAEALRGPLRRSAVNDKLALLYFHQGKYQKAREYLEKHFIAPSPLQRFLAVDLQTYRKLIVIDSILRDNTSALVHYKKYTQLLDSSFTVTKVRQAEELNVMYQTEEKENQIALLNEQSKLEQANLKQATLVKNMTVAGIIAVMIIAGLLYRQSRLRKKNNIVVTHKNEQLQHFLTEKEWLLKEIHHRVKNNLQIVMSLLNSQSAYIDNEPALTAIHDSQHRVHAMSLIHQKLYNSENVSSIDMRLYTRELVTYLADSFNTGQRIRFEYNIEPFEMDVSEAVPLGLILNEAITNSIKYAFPDSRIGLIGISLSHTDPDHCLLSISDNGVGMPAHFTGKKAGSLGMSLMEGLSEDLDGSFVIENNKGTTIKISFAHGRVLSGVAS
jgi:two-component sensor histidine kinase